jgi:hypothetical protein
LEFTVRPLIPGPLLAVCAEITARRETHATLDGLFVYAGASGQAPEGSKHAKALQWLRTTNNDTELQPLNVLGRIIETYMDEALDETYGNKDKLQDREKLAETLARCQLTYRRGGKVGGALATPSVSLEQLIRGRDTPAIESEFQRASANVETSPRDAVSAASNILESICKVYIEEEGLDPPAKQDLKGVWAVVRKELGFDTASVADQDLQRILSGLLSIVDGVGALRTHASSAHGAGTKGYKLEPRHARLAVHAAHTAALFVIESWDKRRAKAEKRQ